MLTHIRFFKAMEGHLGATKLLMKKSNLSKKTQDGQTALMLATVAGHTDIVDSYVHAFKRNLTDPLLSSGYRSREIVP